MDPIVEQMLETMPIAVADRVMTSTFECRPVDPEDAATLASWMQDVHALMTGMSRVETAAAEVAG